MVTGVDHITNAPKFRGFRMSYKVLVSPTIKVAKREDGNSVGVLKSMVINDENGLYNFEFAVKGRIKGSWVRAFLGTDSVLKLEEVLRLLGWSYEDCVHEEGLAYDGYKIGVVPRSHTQYAFYTTPIILQLLLPRFLQCFVVIATQYNTSTLFSSLRRIYIGG